ncbi:hypothetical protein [Paludisphaera soli]|uniref:hypothetical protein n=1 Tax=Paludisphaera soli TaxID=2712865 RepID=UPI0013EBAB64|nr:hypothetical protein [Paludisphaera soli]
MGFLSALRGFLADKSRLDASEESREKFRNAWGLDPEPEPDEEAGASAPGPDADAASEFDKTQWRRKLHHIFEKYPASSDEWPLLMREARALRLDDAWVAQGMKEEFTMMIRGLIADRRLTEEEQARLEAVRKLMGLTEERAAALVRSVVAEAERFFGGDVVVDH